MAIKYSTASNRRGGISLPPAGKPPINAGGVPLPANIPSGPAGGYKPPAAGAAPASNGGGDRGGAGSGGNPMVPFGGNKTPQSASGYPEIESMGINFPNYVDPKSVVANLQNGKTWSGQYLPNAAPGANYNYQPIQTYKPFQFKTPNISNIPANVFNQMKTQNRESAQLGLKSGLAELSKNNANRGLGGKSGILSGQQYSMADDMQDQLAAANRELDLQQGQSQLDVGKMMAQMNMDTQSQQAAQNQGASQFNAGLQQWFQDSNANNQLQNQAQRLQNRQMLGQEAQQGLDAANGMQQAASAQAMAPYNMLMDLFKAQTGVPFQMDGGSSGILGGLMGLGGTLGAAAMKCLPLGTQIEIEDGSTRPVEEIRVGDQVKGGEVIKIFSKKRTKDHWFTKHYFKNGAVITMTMGHPYHDELERTSPDYDEKSPCTCDILTDSGVYYVNGVKLGSTL